jgi:hypothetical protein
MYAGNDREKWARKNQGWALTVDIAEQARNFDWDGDWPEVDTDGYLTGECVEPGGSEEYTVVDVIEPPVGPAYVHEGSGASMAVVWTADLQARRAIETAAPSPGGVIGSVEIEQGNNSDWYVRVYLRSHDAAKLVTFLERMKQEG